MQLTTRSSGRKWSPDLELLAVAYNGLRTTSQIGPQFIQVDEVTPNILTLVYPKGLYLALSFLFPVNNVERGYRNSQCPVRKGSPLIATIFHQSLPNFYSIFIPLKNFIMCSFIKIWQNCCHGNHFLVKLQYIYTDVSSLHEGKWTSYFHNNLHKEQNHFCAVATFLLYTFLHLPSSITII